MKYFRSYRDYLNEAVFIRKINNDKNIFIDKSNTQNDSELKPYFTELFDMLTEGNELNYISKVLELIEKNISQNDKLNFFNHIEKTIPKLFSKGESLFIRTEKLFKLWGELYKGEIISNLFNISKTETLNVLFDYVKKSIEDNNELTDNEIIDIVDIINDDKICLDYTILTYYAKNNRLESELEELRRAIKDWVFINDLDKFKTNSLTSISDIDTDEVSSDVKIKPKELYTKFNMLFNLDNIKESREAVKDKDDKTRRGKDRTPEQQNILNAFIERKKVQTCKVCNVTKPIIGNFNTYVKSTGVAGMENVCRDCK